ncbi:MAG TPA: alpha/beta-type small acid-soluble spore protein [Clostridia bacterium]|nr:alpha/beta-type small acid-soluble spore protein [Clostridia bacterium]
MANNSNSSRNTTSFDQMKYEIANQVGVNLKQGYNGDIASRDAGKIGGNIVKKVFESYTGNNYDINKK